MTGARWRDLIAERGIKIHPAADLFPMMAADELGALAKDIAENGVRQGIVLWTSTRMPVQTAAAAKGAALLDGRNRLAALELAFGHDPERLAERLDDTLFIDANNGARLVGGEFDPWDFVVSANLHRRHLSIEDRKRIAAELLKARPVRSDRAIAKQTHVHHTTVATVRADLEGRGEISHVSTRTDTAGRQQPAIRHQPQPSKLKQIRALREQGASAAAPASYNSAARLRSTIATLHYNVGQAETIDLAAARQGIGRDDLKDAQAAVARCLNWLRNVEAALRGEQ